MHQVGMRPVVVHGGGPQISELMQRLGKVSEFRNGLRVTDAETVDIARMVLIGQVNPQLVAAINVHGPLAVGVSGGGRRAHPRHGARPRARLRRRGDGDQPDDPPPACSTRASSRSWPRSASTSTVRPTTSTPTLSPARSPKLSAAEKLVYLTDIEGSAAAWSTTRPASSARPPLRRTRRADGRRHHRRRDDPQGGELLCTPCSAGVRRAHILDGRIPHVLLLEIFTDEGIGTMVQ